MTDLSAELSPRKAKPIRTAVYQNKAASKAGISERLFALAFSGLVYPQIWEDPEIDMEAMQLARRPSRRHHRVGRLQHSCLPHPLAGCDRRGRPQRGAHRAEPPEARGSPPPAVACRPVPLLRRGRQPAQQRGLRPLHRAQSRRRSRRYWEKRSWRGKRRIAVFEQQLLPHRHARPVHRRSAISPPASTASIRPTS